MVQDDRRHMWCWMTKVLRRHLWCWMAHRRAEGTPVVLDNTEAEEAPVVQDCWMTKVLRRHLWCRMTLKC